MTSLASRTALEGERKQVTVLFADLKGSMELLADRDPEDARTILDPVLERMMEAVHRYDGTVNQVMGDGIMALFGAPVAHEDHAVRACYAALRMQESVKSYAEEAHRAHDVTVEIRVGLNSGEVVVRAIGSDLHMDYTAVGQTTHLAARMEQIASPGTIVAAPATAALVEGFIVTKPLGPVAVKGLTDDLAVHEVTGVGPARTRLEAAAARGLMRFVGRDAELGQLRRAQELARQGRGQIAAIVGEAGVGKSRLVYELTHAHRSQEWLVLEAASVSYGNVTSYSPVIDLLKSYFGLTERDDVDVIRARVTDRLRALDGALEPALPALLALLDVPVDDAAWRMLDPPQRRQRMLQAVQRLLLREAREQPLLLIFEDLQWVDGETQALLDSLVDQIGAARVLLLVTHRAEYRHAWASKTYYRQVRLDGLRAEIAAELLDALLGDDPGLGPLKELLVARGNPFFLEETVRTLVQTKALVGERGRYRLTQPVPTIRIPPTVQAMLAARIDRLSPDDKGVLQIAAVVGTDVPLSLLEAIADRPHDALRRGLDRLQSAEFLYETGRDPDLEYSFTHALTHEVAYGGLLHERRRELHARIVGAIETLHADRLAQHVERLAHHAVRGELREKAVDYLRRAGLKAAARSALSDARVRFEQALSVLETLPERDLTLEQAFEIRLELRPVLSQLGETRRALARLLEAEALAERLNDDRRRGRVCAFATTAYSQLGDLDEARASGARALAIAHALGDLPLRILTTDYLEQVHLLRGEYERVIELATDNLAAMPSDWVHEYFGNTAPVAVDHRCSLVVALGYLGRFAEAAEHEAAAIRLAEPTEHPFTIGLAYRAAATLHLLAGDWARAHSLMEHGISVIRSGNVAFLLPSTVASSAWVLAELGEASEALSRLREGGGLLERHATRGNLGQSSWAYHALGRACLRLGRVDEARRLGDRALESAPRHPGYAAHALHLLGDIATHPDRFDGERGEARYREALALAEPRGMRPLVAHCRLGLGTLYRRMGKRQQATEHLAAATAMYREMEMTSWLARAEAETRETV